MERKGRVAIVTLNRPKALNALNDALMNDLNDALNTFASDNSVGAVVITGSKKAFAGTLIVGWKVCSVKLTNCLDSWCRY